MKKTKKLHILNGMRSNSTKAYLIKKKGKSNAVSLLRYGFLISFSYVLLYPLLYMISHAFQNPVDYLDPTVQWVPKNYTFTNFDLGIEVLDIWNAMKTTVSMQLVSAVIEIVSCGIAGYGMARFKFKGKKIFNALLMINILVPVTMIIIPSYLNFRYMDVGGILGVLGDLFAKELRPNLLNTPFVFYLPSVFAVGLQAGLFIYIYIQFFKGFPQELEEAAWIDGAGPWRTFFSIVVPSSGVAVLTVSIFSVIWHWNEYYQPAMYLSVNFPLAVKIHDAFEMFHMANYNVYSAEAINGIMASCLLFIAPMLIMYLILQRQFIESITKTGIVG